MVIIARKPYPADEVEVKWWFENFMASHIIAAMIAPCESNVNQRAITAFVMRSRRTARAPFDRLRLTKGDVP
jgi:hypothetical protein